MIAFVRSIGRFDGRSSFGTWVYRIAAHASSTSSAATVADPRPRRRGDERPVERLVDPLAGRRVEAAALRLADRRAPSTISPRSSAPGRAARRRRPRLRRDRRGAVVPVGTVKSRIHAAVPPTRRGAREPRPRRRDVKHHRPLPRHHRHHERRPTPARQRLPRRRGLRRGAGARRGRSGGRHPGRPTPCRCARRCE